MRRGNIMALLLSSFTALQAQTKQAVELSGKVANMQTGKVFLQKFDNKLFTTVDVADITNGKFAFHTPLVLPELYGISLDTSRTPMYVFLEKGPITVQLDSARYYANTVVTGSASQDLFAAFKKQENVNISDFIKAHPASLVSAYVLYRNYSYKLTPEQIQENIALLDPSLHSTPYVTFLKELTGVMANVAIGKKAPDFTANDPEGKPVKFSDHWKGYVLLDFWASWCAPCRKENPNVVAAFQKYKDKGFSVYGVSLDKAKEGWVKAIANDHLDWTQVSELNYWQSEIAKQYGVRAIPANFLIDSNGIIVGKNLRGEQLQQKLEELLGKSGGTATKKVFKGQGPIQAVNTESRPVQRQWKGIFNEPGDYVFFRNDFDCARLNGLVKTNDSIYTALITSENTPINGSPWYAFKVWSKKPKRITITLTYQQGAKHRYTPKFSKDGKTWTLPTDASVDVEPDSLPDKYSFAVNAGPDTVWVAGQELYTYQQVLGWIADLGKQTKLTTLTIGKTRAGRPLTLVKMGNLHSKKRILILGRQHPPEVTGQFALNAFVEALAANTVQAKAFKEQFLIYVIPFMNPDGVADGNWRHNEGGIDLNRDWQDFHQPESQAVRDFLKKELADNENKLLFSIDFHSTWDDIYYIVDPKLKGNMPGFVTDWLQQLKERIPGYVPNVKPLYSAPPTSTAFSYLFQQYGTEALVYEIGDKTPRDFIKHKGQVAAEALMEMLSSRAK
ncbi:zinc carboxypeptidase domain protein [Filimonas lacunae]|nr:zinc carboxypeptidase domain protein [Filimonas lacunae]